MEQILPSMRTPVSSYFFVLSLTIEVTTLVVPGGNDRDEDMAAIASFLASVSPDIPLHVTRFFPRFQMQDSHPTPVSDVYRLADVARQKLTRVLTGNC